MVAKASFTINFTDCLLIALDNIDEVIRIVRGSDTVAGAKQELMLRFSLTDIQTQTIVDMRLRAVDRKSVV